MSASIRFASGLASGGRRLMWVFYTPAVFFWYFLLTRTLVWPTRGVMQFEITLLATIAVCCFVLGYFVVGRIPNWRIVSNVHHQVPDAVAVFGADAFARAYGSGSVARSRANVLCITTSGLQLWAGRGDSARPVSSLAWNDITAISANGGAWSSVIAVTVARDTAPLMLSVLSAGVFSTSRIRRRARARLIAQLDALRDPGPAHAKVI